MFAVLADLEKLEWEINIRHIGRYIQLDGGIQSVTENMILNLQQCIIEWETSAGTWIGYDEINGEASSRAHQIDS